MAQYVYKKLAKSEGCWRVDGVASINSKEHPGRYIEVNFSRINPDSIAAHRPYGVSASKFPFNESRSLRFHCVALSHFRVGSIWYKGREVAQPTRIAPCIVDVDQVKYVRLGEEVTLNGQTFPSIISSNHLHFAGDNKRQLAPTLFAVLPVKGEKDERGWSTHYLVIPATELFVFYLAGSTRLISIALQDRLRSYVAFEESEYDGKTVSLRVKERLTNLEAYVLARAVSSKQANDALLSPNKNLTLSSLKRINFFEPPKPTFAIKGEFPFSGETRLHVLGRRWNYSEEGKTPLWIAYVMEITRCDHPFDFKEVIQINDQLTPAAKTVPGLSERTVRIVPTGDIDTDRIELNGQAADRRLPRKQLPHLQNLFAAEGIEHKLMTNEIFKEYKRSRTNIPQEITGTTLDDGDCTNISKGNLGVDSVPVQEKLKDRVFGDFLQVARRFESEAMAKKKWAVEFECINERAHQHNEENVALTNFPIFIRNKHALRWHKVELDGGKFRPRWLMLMRVNLEHHRCFYLLEMETKDRGEGRCTVMLHTPDFTKCCHKTFDSFLELTVIQNRWVSADDKDNWTVDNRRDEAKLLFTKLVVHRLGYPPKALVGDFDSEERNEESRLRTDAWCQWLIDTVDRILV